MSKEKAGEPTTSDSPKAEAGEAVPATPAVAAPGWWLCRIDDSNPREFAVLAADEAEAVEKFKRGAAIRATIHEIFAWKLPEDFKPSEQDLATEKRLVAAD